MDEDELETVTLDELLDPLYAYAEKTAVRPIEKVVAAVMDIVSLRPGEMKDMFESLSAHPAKALEWAFDYAVKTVTPSAASADGKTKATKISMSYLPIADKCRVRSIRNAIGA